MSGTTHTSMPGAAGAFHTGSGAQYIHFHAAGQDPLYTPSSKAPREIDMERRLRLKRCFSRPEGVETAAGLLREQHFVLLAGEPGSGRRTAATVLLCELPRGSGNFRELLPETDDGKPAFPTPDVVEDEDRLLLDLSDADDKLWRTAQRELLGFRSRLTACRAHLAVAAPAHSSPELAADLRALRAEIKRPDPLDALLRHLRDDGIRDIRPLLDAAAVPTLTAHLASRPTMDEVAHLADLIREARRGAKPGTSLTDWCAQAVAAVTDRGDAVDKLVAAQPDGAQRALLLATAMLHGGPTETVHRAAQKLLDQVKQPPDQRPRLEQDGLAERLRPLDAELRQDGTVRFTRLRTEDAVLRHFWDNRPDLRGSIRMWTGQLVRLPGIGPADVERFIDRYAAESIRTDGGLGLLQLAEGWTGPDAGEAELRAAVTALAAGLRDPGAGRHIRARLYRWATSSGLGTGRRRVLVDTCRSALAERYPDITVVRLHQAARREPPSGPALGAMRELAGRDHRFLRRVLSRLAGELERTDAAADPQLFLALAEPGWLTEPTGGGRPLIAEPGVRDRLTAGWRAVYARAPEAVWRPWAREWLRTAHAAGSAGGRLLEVLTDAAAGRYHVFNSLYLLALDESLEGLPGLLLRKTHERTTP
ncbi:hypothetical protein [Streptomyces boninensis]|uniref:hypothetical protein n=1 Tax=Streptomyces boninensis TaxID=2039455 RepID=UPI003B20CC53